MIRRIFNWTFSSFFRTLGRFLFYILIGVLAYFCINGFPKVHAETIQISSITDLALQAGNNWLGFTQSKIGSFYSLLAEKEININSPHVYIGTFHFSKPLTETYFYIYGYSSTFETIDSMSIVYGACENVSNSGDTPPSKPQQSTNSGISSFAFKCSVTRDNLQEISYRFFGHASGSDSVVFTPRIYIYQEVNTIPNYNASDKQQQELIEQNEKQMEQEQKQHEETMNTITDSSTSDAENKSNSFFSDFDNNDYGLSDVISMPLNVIKNITSSKCTPLSIPIPFVDTNVTLPCMNTIYSQFFGDVLTIYQTITTGMIAYWVCINIFAMVKGFKDPDSDNVEVMEL